MPSVHARAIELLRRDRLRQIVPLKMLAAYPDATQSFVAEIGDDAGVLVLLPTAASIYDRQTYPESDYVVLMTATSELVVRQLVSAIPINKHLIFKFADPNTRGSLAEYLPLTHITAFHSFTTRPDQHFTPDPLVAIIPTLDDTSVQLFAHQGYQRDELAGYFRDPQACAFLRLQDGVPLAGCFVYRNDGEIFEIGGVYTHPHSRRQGHARAVVETALAVLTERGQTPRYQVHEHNLASLRLAEQIGLERFVVIEHWRHVGDPLRAHQNP